MLGLAFSVAPSAKAQVSINVNVGSRPPVYRYVDYAYVAPRPVVVHHRVYNVKHRPHAHYYAPKKHYKKSYRDNRRHVEYRRHRH